MVESRGQTQRHHDAQGHSQERLGTLCGPDTVDHPVSLFHVGRCHDRELARPEEVLRLGADAIAVSLGMRHPNEGKFLKILSQMVEEADRIGLPVISHIYPREFSKGGTIVHDPENTMWAVRCGIECGADVIKVPFTGDAASYRQIVTSSPVPVVAAGGPRCDTLRSALEMMTKVVESGAWGSTIGRNIWGAPDPTPALIAFRAVIHDQMTPDAALEAAGLLSRPAPPTRVAQAPRVGSGDLSRSRQQVVEDALLGGGHIVYDGTSLEAVRGDDGSLNRAVQLQAGAARQELAAVHRYGGAIRRPHEGRSSRGGAVEHAGVKHHVFRMVDLHPLGGVDVPFSSHNGDLRIGAVNDGSVAVTIPVPGGDIYGVISAYGDSRTGLVGAAVQQTAGEGATSRIGVRVDFYARWDLEGDQPVEGAPVDSPQAKGGAGGQMGIAPDFDVMELDKIIGFADLDADVLRLDDEDVRESSPAGGGRAGGGDGIIRR